MTNFNKGLRSRIDLQVLYSKIFPEAVTVIERKEIAGWVNREDHFDDINWAIDTKR